MDLPGHLTGNYLRAIYELTEEGDGGSKTSEVAEKLDVSPASASEAVQKLEEQDLVCRAPYKGFTLSPAGREKGKELSEKNTVLTDFFQEIGVEDYEEEADRVEHSISKDAVNRIQEQLDKLS